MQMVDEAQALPGVGLAGDRYALGTGSFFKPLPDYELTLIEAEAVEAAQIEHGLQLLPGESRRNLVTRGVGLNALVGCEFQVGGVRLRGIRLCEPCRLLQALTRQPVMRTLRHRGGLRAQILTEGLIRVGDIVTV
jgi:MOSC domain-containing protein YiiM